MRMTDAGAGAEPRATELSTFTRYVRALAEGPGEPEPQHFGVVWEALGKILAHELRKRGLWTSPPRYLGVNGARHWKEGEAFEELLEECYLFVFVDRLRNLAAHLEAGRNLDGLVFLNVRNFLYDTQKKNDPLGFRLFEVLQRCVQSAIEAGRIHLEEGETPVSNRTLLSFAPDREGKLATRQQLANPVGGWCDELLPELVTARGKKLAGTEERLVERIAALAEDGVGRFRFQDLAACLKKEVRSRWAALLDHEEGDVAFEDGADGLPTLAGTAPGRASRVRRVDPDTRVEDWDSFTQLVDCVSEALERHGADEPAQAWLETLWNALRMLSTEGEEIPSRRQLAVQLGIPRDRLPELFTTLGQLSEECRQERLAERFREGTSPEARRPE